jgi:hypothetical protein
MEDSSWGQKLQVKLSTLSEASSNESLQTLAKWIGFNRKHHDAFCAVLKTALTPGGSASAVSSKQQLNLFKVLSMVLLLEKGNTKKWDRFAELRIAVGESVILPAVEEQPTILDASVKDALPTMLKEWDDANVFGGPTLIHQIRKQLEGQSPPETVGDAVSKEMPIVEAAAPAQVDEAEAKQDTASENPHSSPSLKASVGVEDKETPADQGMIEPEGSKNTVVAADEPTVTYDFESSGTEPKTVAPKDFLEPSRPIATLQIARDLRNDSAVQLSALLSSLPEDIRKVCADAAESEASLVELEDVRARDFAVRTNEALIDMDVAEQIANVRTYRRIVQQIRQARQSLLTLVLQSRCQFGADEAAEAFLNADRAKEELRKRKQILVDAMELEGIDPQDESETKNATEEIKLAPLSWYNPEGKTNEPDAKRIKAVSSSVT